MNVVGASVLEANTDAAHETRDILLPNQTEHVAQIAVDIGGSLAKIVYFTWFEKDQDRRRSSGGRLHFKKFETERIDECIEFIAELVKNAQESGNNKRMVLKATGGGAYLYYEKLKNKLPGVHVQKEDEMECLITGLNFFITEIPYEAFTYDEQEKEPMQFEMHPPSHNVYPYILVNIGSGVSLLKVTGPDEFTRISGTSLGGGTLWGLMSLLTKAKSFDEMLEMSVTGDNRNVDLLVGDIYGTDYTKLGLKASRIASSFGKVFKRGQQPADGQFDPPDIAKSLLFMVSNNIGQIAYLNAQQHNVKNIYFGGCFIRGHPITMNTLSYAIKFWSGGSMKALFLRHEGHLGATGAFLKYHPIRKARHSFSYSEKNFKPDTNVDPSKVYGVLEETNVELRSPPKLENDHPISSNSSSSSSSSSSSNGDDNHNNCDAQNGSASDSFEDVNAYGC